MADAISSNDRTSRVAICGLWIDTNRSVAMDPDDILPDGTCEVWFGSKALANADWHVTADWQVSGDGHHAIIPKAGDTSEIRAMQVRQVAPFAAALQGKLTLHASCIALRNAAYAFIGESGAGKSTFAATLRMQGWRRLCDDLLPIRENGAGWVVPAPTGPLILEGIFFLERGAPQGGLSIDSLAPQEALMQLLRNGFGELHAARVWQSQFQDYARIARSVPCHRLAVPHGLSALPGHAAEWSQRILRVPV